MSDAHLQWTEHSPIMDGVYRWKPSMDVEGTGVECWGRIIGGKLYDLDLTNGKRIIRDGDPVKFGGVWKGPYSTICWPLAK
jgi:hypothetical protein